MKKTIIYAIAGLLLTCGLLSCEKNLPTPPVSSSLTIVNAIPGAGALVCNFNYNTQLQWYKTAQQIPAYTSATPFYEFSGYIGDIPLSVSQFTDTTHTVFKGLIHIDAGSTHSLFLTGTLTTPDSVYTTDKVSNITDSLVNVRFINLSTGSSPINIDVLTSGVVGAPIVSNLAYKAQSAFIPFTVTKATPASGSYALEFRDAGTNKVLVTYTFNQLLPNGSTGGRIFKSVTVGFKGVPGGTGANAQGVLVENNF